MNTVRSWRNKILSLVLAGLVCFCGVNSSIGAKSIDMTPYKNTKILVYWETYVFNKTAEIKSDAVRDFAEFKSDLVDWEKIAKLTDLDMDVLYKSAKGVHNQCKVVAKTSSKDGKIYYTGLSKKNIKKLKESLMDTRDLYKAMESQLVLIDAKNTGYYKSQCNTLNKAIKQLTSSNINSISDTFKSYGNSLPRDYFKIVYKTVSMSEDEEIEVYNSLYTQLVSGCVALNYGKEDNIKYNDTVVATDVGKGYVIYPTSLVGRVKYIKVTYIVE